MGDVDTLAMCCFMGEWGVLDVETLAMCCFMEEWGVGDVDTLAMLKLYYNF